MHVSSISSMNFESSYNVKYYNIPKELQESEPVLEQLAKDNSVTLSISKSPETKYLSQHDMYTIIAEKSDNKNSILGHWGTSVLLASKDDSKKSVLKKLNEKVAIAIFDAQKKFIESNLVASQIIETNLTSEKIKKSSVQKFKDFFKQLLKK